MSTKYLPFLRENKTYLFDEIEKYCQEKNDDKVKTKFYNSFLENIELVKRNY